MSLDPVPTRPEITQEGQKLSPTYLSWFNSIWVWLGPQGKSGATAARPTKGLWVGLAYYDTTLGLPVFVHQVSPAMVA